MDSQTTNILSNYIPQECVQIIIIFYSSLMEEENKKIKKCFQDINWYWPVSYYLTSPQDWVGIIKFISIEKTPWMCTHCGTYWLDPKFLFKEGNYVILCSACDTHQQPFLSNPKNRSNVLKYINPIYHDMIFRQLSNKVIFKNTINNV